MAWLGLAAWGRGCGLQLGGAACGLEAATRVEGLGMFRAEGFSLGFGTGVGVERLNLTVQGLQGATTRSFHLFRS